MNFKKGVDIIYLPKSIFKKQHTCGRAQYMKRRETVECTPWVSNRMTSQPGAYNNTLIFTDTAKL